MQAFIAEDWTNRFNKESNFYNAKGDVVRGYELAKHDVFELSAEGFTGEELAVGKKVTYDSVSKKLKVETA